MNLIIDQGNTTIKLAVFNAFALETVITYDTWDEPAIEDFLSGYNIEACRFFPKSNTDVPSIFI